MKRKYHSTKYRPNGSLRVEAENYGTVCNATARQLKREAASEMAHFINAHLDFASEPLRT